MKKILFRALLVLAVVSSAIAQKVVPVQNEKRFVNDLRVELSAGSYDDDSRPLLTPNSGAHLHFILFSNRDGLKVYERWNLWGYFLRSFSAEDANGKKFEITVRGGEHWTRNFPSTHTIDKGDVLVTNEYICGMRVSPMLPESPKGIVLRLTGRFAIQDTPANRAAVWTGNVETPSIEVMLDKACVAALNTE